MNAPWTLPQKPGSAVFDEGARSLKTLPKGSVQGAHLRDSSRGGGAPPQPCLNFLEASSSEQLQVSVKV
jgi:hypothetical protein